MKKITQFGAIILLSMTFTACATPLKAPCGPTAGLTDPCGNAKPINKPDATHKQVKTVDESYLKLNV